MRSARHHIERIRAQPHHVRKRVTFAIAGTVAGVIGVGWFGGSFVAGAFTLHPTSFAQALNSQQPAFATTTASSTNLAGAAAALEQQQSEPAHIVIVNAPPATTTSAANQTTIPF